ncbi:hypothetical protein [Listeria grandensis]|uniref:hypothetical protein n=1 Tax=Listeria grandensis TaxID=1494963 RepID=UPI00164E7C01|nr:hypothetical protein [Listeria grandensis]MBC6316515.1 hypothetical protein [Listeria grandensis]
MRKVLRWMTILLCVGMIFPFTGEVQAQDNKNVTAEELYSIGVEKGAIDAHKYPLNEWLKDEKNTFKPTYDLSVQNDIFEGMSYEAWLVLNNFGVMKGSNEPVGGEKSTVTGTGRSAADNIEKFCATVKAGDILIVSEKTSSGFIGHAAIANGDNHILEMTGGANWKNGIKDNNNQYTKREWINKNIKYWTSVYRLQNQSLAKTVATYADKNYYSSKGAAVKDRHIDYKITSALKSTDPNYCSKLVYQAYYFGTGSLPVMMPVALPTILPPTNLLGMFQNRYLPQFVGRY